MKKIKRSLDKNKLKQFLTVIPYAEYLEIDVDRVTNESITLKININKWNLNECCGNNINYSALYGPIDTAAYLVILNRLGEFRPAVTLSLKVNHLSNEILNDDIYFKATCIEIKKEYAFSFIKVFRSNEIIIANANATFLFKPLSFKE